MSTIKIIQKIEKSIPNRISYCNSVWEIATDSVDITKWIEEIVVMIKTADIDLMRLILSMLMLKVTVLDRLEDGTPIIELQGIIPYRVDKRQNQIRIETQPSNLATTTAQTSALLYEYNQN